MRRNIHSAQPKSGPASTSLASTPRGGSLLVLTTGGTFEKRYRPELNGLGFTESGLDQWSRQCRLPAETRLQTLMLVDSLDMTEQERQHLAQTIQTSPEQRIVVIHGTDTMVASAKAISAAQRPEQTVVITGAMIPASQPESDALFNLGLAIAAAQLSPAGCYIAMSGEILQAVSAQKNKSTGRFAGERLYLPIQK
jgi:L-asparaginase